MAWARSFFIGPRLGKRSNFLGIGRVCVQPVRLLFRERPIITNLSGGFKAPAKEERLYNSRSHPPFQEDHDEFYRQRSTMQNLLERVYETCLFLEQIRPPHTKKTRSIIEPSGLLIDLISLRFFLPHLFRRDEGGGGSEQKSLFIQRSPPPRELPLNSP